MVRFGRSLVFRRQNVPEDVVLGWSPWNIQLLRVDDLVSVDNLTHDVLSLLLVHHPNVLKAVLVRLLEALKLHLELLVLLREVFKLIGVLHIFLLEAFEFLCVVNDDSANHAFVTIATFLKHIFRLLVDERALTQNAGVELKLLFIEAVDSLHVLHALFEDLHLLLELDLLFGLVVCIL